MKTEKYIAYRGKGEHSVNELEKIIEQREEELHVIKSRPTTLPSDEEIRIFAELQSIGYVAGNYERDLITLGAKWMRSICEAKIAEMERELKRANQLLQQHIDFRAECTALNDPAITEIDDKHFPF